MSVHLARITAATALAGALTAALAGPASAGTTAPPQGNTAMGGFARLGELNHSGARGAVRLEIDGTRVDVSVYASGLLRRAPHAMHFHAGGMGTCPSMTADDNGDGIISTTEGHHAYGMVVSSLTLSGDTSPASALAIDRFPTTPYGHLVYRRTVTVSAGVAEQIRSGNAVVVVHGIDPDRSGTYDGAARSDLDPALPLEATSPALCGAVHTYTR